MASPEKKPIGKLIDGCLDLSNRDFGDDDLRRLPSLSHLKVLILSNTQITNFANLKPQPNLEVVVAVNCPLSFLNGLSDQKSLKSLDISGTPLEKVQNFRLHVISAVGNNLDTLNNVKITKEEQQMAEVANRKKKDKFFIKVKSQEEKNQQEANSLDRQTLDAMTTVYIKEHLKLFSPYAENEAILFDLENNGPLPVIDETSTEEDLERAIRDVKQRNLALKDAIRQKCEQLDIPCQLDS